MKKRNEFRRRTERLWETWSIGETVKFDVVLSTLHRLLAVRDRPETLSIYFGQLLGIYENEDERNKRINDATERGV